MQVFLNGDGQTKYEIKMKKKLQVIDQASPSFQRAAGMHIPSHPAYD